MDDDGDGSSLCSMGNLDEARTDKSDGQGVRDSVSDAGTNGGGFRLCCTASSFVAWLPSTPFNHPTCIALLVTRQASIR